VAFMKSYIWLQYFSSFRFGTLDRYQIQRNGQAAVGEETYSGIWDTLVKLHRAYGITGMFRGATARILFHTPSTAITMAGYDYFKQLFTSLNK
jgi:hypothetical protein